MFKKRDYVVFVLYDEFRSVLRLELLDNRVVLELCALERDDPDLTAKVALDPRVALFVSSF